PRPGSTRRASIWRAGCSMDRPRPDPGPPPTADSRSWKLPPFAAERPTPIVRAPLRDSAVSGPSVTREIPITERAQLVDYVASGEKPPADWRIGTEHEKFGFRLDDLRPPTWEGERGIGALLEGLTRFGWQRIEENGKLIALQRDGGSVTLEPAGQLELSGAPLS